MEQGSKTAVNAATRSLNRPYIEYGKDYSQQLAAARGQPTGTGGGTYAGGGATFGAPGPSTFNPADWRFAGRQGIYINPNTGEKLSPNEYKARAGIVPEGPALNSGEASDLYNEFNGGAGTFAPGDYTDAELAAMELANSPRFAELDPNERRAAELAASGSGMYTADLDRARQLTERGAGTFLDADIAAYMNPYIKGALDPAARELRQSIAQDVKEARSQAARAGAFGGSRGTLLETETKRGGTQALKDLYQQGYASAFESAAQRFNEDRNAAARGADQFRALGAQGQQSLVQDINTLLTTGGIRRALEQNKLDFNFNKFLEARDWDINNLKPLLATLSSVPHGVEQENVAKTGAMGNIIGIAATIAGAYFGGPAGAQAGGSVLAANQNQGTIMDSPSTGGGASPALNTFGGAANPGGTSPGGGYGYVPTNQTFYA